MKLLWTLGITLLSIIYYPVIELAVRNSIKHYFTPVDNIHHDVNWRTKSLENKKSSDLPNILFIIADDLGFNDANQLDNIKSIYQNGVIFNNAYAGHATCAPSRAALLTGKFPTKIGAEFTPHPASLDIMMHFQHNIVHSNILNITNLWNTPSMEYLALDKSEILISNVLKQHNYTNYYVGKWHLGEMDGHRPLERGYDESLSFLYGASMYGEETDKGIVSAEITKSLYDTYMSKWIPFGISHNNNKMFKPNEYMTDYLSNSVVDIIKNEQSSSDPFFITLGYNAPHNPYQALKSDYDLEKGDDHNRKVYNAMLKSVDRGVGKIIQTLKDTNKYDNTLIIFTSDNGGTHLIELDDINYPLNGWKCTFLEGGVKVPLFMQWPNKIPAKSSYNKTVSHVDIFPTITSLVNYENNDIDGVNLFSYMSDNDNEPHESLFWRSADYKALKVNNWKLSVASEMNKTWFFNLDNDPKEENNLVNFIHLNKTLEHKYNKMYEQLINTNNAQKEPSWKSSMKTSIPLYGVDIVSEHDEFVYWSI